MFGDVQRLRAFSLVLDLGSISAAAGVLGYTQSAVSQQLAALEREAGTPLLDRSQRPLRPTPAGEALKPQVERVLAALASAEAVLEDLGDGSSRVRVVAFPSALSTFVPAAVRDLRRQDDTVLVQIAQQETLEAVDTLRAGEADLAVVHYLPGIAVPDLSGLQRRHLLTDPLRVVLPSGHPLARREAISIADLEGIPMGMPRRDTPAGRFRSLVFHLCSQAGFEPRIAYEIDDLPAAVAFAAAGIGLGLMHALTHVHLPPGVTSLPLIEGEGRAIEVLASTSDPNPATAAMIEMLARSALAYKIP